MDTSLRRFRTRYLVLAVLVGGGSLVSASCASSPESLERAAQDKPGVLKVETVDNGGEDDIPFSSLPQLVTVKMKSSATEDQVQDVVDEYEGDLKSESVEALTIVLEGEVSGKLELGRTSADTDRFVDAFTAAVQYPGAENVWVGTENTYDAEDNDLYLHFANLTMRSAGFDQVREAFATLGPRMTRDGIDLTTASDGFRLAGDRRSSGRDVAQLRVAGAVAERFGLLGADVTGARRMSLRVPAGTDVGAVRALVRMTASQSEVGRTVIEVGADVDLSGVPAGQRESVRRVINRIRLDQGFTSAEFRGGELRIWSENVGTAFSVDSLVHSSLAVEPGTEDRLEADYLPLTVRYLLPGGSEVLKQPGVSVSGFVDTYELSRQGWRRITMSASGSGARLRLAAPRAMSRSDARYYVRYQADGPPRGAPLEIVVRWPAGSGQPPLVRIGT